MRARHRLTLATLCSPLLITLTSCGTEAPTPPADEPDDPPPNTGQTARCEPTSGNGWIWTDVGEGTKPVVSLNDAGAPYVAFMAEARPGWVRVSSIQRSTGSAGAPVTFAEGYFYGPFDMDASGGRIQVAYHDHDREDLVLARQDADGTLELFPQQNPGHDGWHGAIKRDPLGGVHIASLDPSGFGGKGAFYSFFQDGNYDIELAIPGSFMYDGGLSVDVAPDGTVYMVTYDDVDGVALLGRRSGPGSWGIQTIEPADTLLEAGRFPQIKVDDNGVLHIAYLARISRSSGTIRYASGAFGALNIESVASVTDIDINMGLGARNMVDIDFMNDGTPVVAYQTMLETGIAWKGASGWELREQLPARLGVRLRQQVSMAIFDDVVNLTFWQGDLPGMVCYGRK